MFLKSIQFSIIFLRADMFPRDRSTYEAVQTQAGAAGAVEDDAADAPLGVDAPPGPCVLRIATPTARSMALTYGWTNMKSEEEKSRMPLSQACHLMEDEKE